MPRRNPLEIWDFEPSKFALRLWREERQKLKEICEETRRITTGVGMKPVDQPTRPVDTLILLLLLLRVIE